MIRCLSECNLLICRCFYLLICIYTFTYTLIYKLKVICIFCIKTKEKGTKKDSSYKSKSAIQICVWTPFSICIKTNLLIYK